MTRTVAAAAALALAAGSLWLWAAVAGRRQPLTLGLLSRDGARREVPVYDLDAVRARRWAPAPVDRARWEGVIALPEAEAEYDVAVAADAPTSVTFGGFGSLQHTGRPGRTSASLRLRSLVPVAVEHQLQDAGDTQLRVLLTRRGGEAQRLETLIQRVSTVAARLRPWAGGVFLMSALLALALAAPRVRSLPPEERSRVLRRGAHAGALLLTLYGGLLRAEALASKYADAPHWASQLVPVAQDLHPRGMKWIPPEHPHQGDPFGYLRLARESRGFYAASVREPVFVWVTRQMTLLLPDRDVAVSAASMIFSVLLVPATYLLGLAAFSPGVGLGAAAAVAVERQLIGLGVDGWRDDAFAVFAVLAAAALVRLQDRPTVRRGLAAGLVLGLGVLTRITSLSFALPALALLAVLGGRPARPRLLALAAAALLAAALAAPFLIACGREYGDPLHSINAHTRFYRSRAAGGHEVATTWHSFLREGRGLYGFVDTGLVGLTSYPFGNKWQHFDYLGEGIGPVLAVAAVVGLLLWPFTARGRLLLVVLIGSLLPYAFTWDIPGGSEWRFTLHAYPFYLVAAASALGLTLSAARWLRRQDGRRLIRLAAALPAAALGLYLGLCGLARARASEDVAAGRPATIAVGPRDRFFFGPGWSWPRIDGHVFVRRAAAGTAEVRLPLRAGRAHRLTLRLSAESATNVSVMLNSRPLAELPVIPDERRFGRYDVDIPSDLAVEGAHSLQLRATAPFALWLIHVSQND